MIGIFYIIIACFLWATDALFRYPLVGTGLSSIKIVFYEHFILALIFVPFLFLKGKRFLSTTIAEVFFFFVVGGIGSALATIAFTKAFSLINPSLVILLQKFQPVWAIMLARFVLGESISPKFLFWAAICLLGAFMISAPDLMKISAGNLFNSSAMSGYFWVLISIIGWGSATVFGKRLSATYTHLEIMCGRFLMAFICILPFFLEEASAGYFPGFEASFKILVMVMLSGLGAMYFYYKGLGKISAKSCALLELFFPFSAVVVNWVFLGQSLTQIQLIGGGLLMLGSSIIQLNRY